MSARGTVLITVAGLASLIATLALAFLMRMRSDADESDRFLHEVRAHVMLTAALQYVAETARLGWDDPATPEHEQAFGWVDVRDGTAGPKGADGRPLVPLDGAWFPAFGGRAARCPMHVLRRPPYAMSLRWRTNPIPTDDLTLPWSDLVGYDQPAPEPSPKPQREPGEDYAAWSAGDPRPRLETLGLGWFRVARPDPDRPAVFVLTCGSGATDGWRDWSEIPSDQRDAYGSAAEFAQLREAEQVLWYEAAWTSAVGANVINRTLYKGTEVWALNRLGNPLSYAQLDDGSYLFGMESQNSRQFTGSFLYIERLASEPAAW